MTASIRPSRTRGRSRFRPNAPIENWPLSRNEDHGALPKPGMTLEQFQREGTGDRHLIVVDPATSASTSSSRRGSPTRVGSVAGLDLRPEFEPLRPERWTSSDAAGLPIFPAVVRYDEVARGLVRHAMRVTVRRTRARTSTRRRISPAHTDANLPRMGERLRLRKDFDTSGFPPARAGGARGAEEATACSSPTTAATGYVRRTRSPFRRARVAARVKGSDFEVIVPTGPTEGHRASGRTYFRPRGNVAGGAEHTEALVPLLIRLLPLRR